MNFRKATRSDIPDVKNLWKEIFGDTDDYISRFITHFGIENCYVCEIYRKTVAMAFAILTDLKSPSNFEGVPEGRGSLYKYIYACATHPDFQSQGIMKNLLAYLYENACKENVDGIFLQAENQSLAEYYQKLGFEKFFFRDHFFYNKFNHKECEKTLRSLRLNIITPENYHKKRIEKLATHYFVDWNKDFFRFLYESGTQFCEYENTIFSFKTNMNNIIVDELLGDASHEQIADFLFEEFPDFDEIQIRTPFTTNRTPYFCCGQIKWCFQTKNHPKNGWLGFAME